MTRKAKDLRGIDSPRRKWRVTVTLESGEPWEWHGWAETPEAALGLSANEFPQAVPGGGLAQLADARVTDITDE